MDSQKSACPFPALIMVVVVVVVVVVTAMWMELICRSLAGCRACCCRQHQPTAWSRRRAPDHSGDSDSQSRGGL
jgi:hypothetical protein